MTKLFPLVTLLACLAAGYTFADETEHALPSDSRIKFLKYDETDVYTVTTRYGYETNIVFGKGEEIQTVSVGDRSLWQITPAGNRLFIRPMYDNVSTNMTVLTNKHAYEFDLTSLGDKKDGNFYVAQFVYPDENEDKSMHLPAQLPPVAAAWHEPPAYQQPEPVAAPVMPHNDAPGITRPVYPNYNYTYSGPDDLAPLQVYDDGKTTFIKYQDIGQPVPNIFAVESNGAEQPMPYTVKDGLMVIDGIAPEMALKNSDGAVHIYNEMLKPQ